MKRNVKIAEIVLVIAIILFVIFAAVTYKNLGILSNGLSEGITEVTTVMEGE